MHETKGNATIEWVALALQSNGKISQDQQVARIAYLQVRIPGQQDLLLLISSL
jgi:hypothetical protein